MTRDSTARDRVDIDLANFQLQEDADDERGDEITAWRRKRESELECGDDPQALYATVIRNDESLDVLWDFIVYETVPDLDQRILKVRDLMTRIVQETLDFEEAREFEE